METFYIQMSEESIRTKNTLRMSFYLFISLPAIFLTDRKVNFKCSKPEEPANLHCNYCKGMPAYTTCMFDVVSTM